MLLCFLSMSVFYASAHQIDSTDTTAELKIHDQQIIYQEEILGKIETLRTDATNAESEDFTIEIFSKKGDLVAKYNVKMLARLKKNKDYILSAELKTLKDNVVHNGSNFLDFHSKSFSNEKMNNLLQIDKAVKYLFAHRYL